LVKSLVPALRAESRTRVVDVLCLLPLVACALVGGSPPIFPASEQVSRFDFESDTLNQPPRGLGPGNSGRWAVADSPTAVSGRQVLVRRGDDSGLLAIETPEHAERVGGEVSIRVLLGRSGAGIGCEGSDGAAYVLEAEPEERRVALYRRASEGRELVASHEVEVIKGKWVRLGIRCEPELVVGYLNGKAVLRESGSLEGARLGLFSNAGVTAQFDDLTYAAQ